MQFWTDSSKQSFGFVQSWTLRLCFSGRWTDICCTVISRTTDPQMVAHLLVMPWKKVAVKTGREENGIKYNNMSKGGSNKDMGTQGCCDAVHG